MSARSSELVMRFTPVSDNNLTWRKQDAYQTRPGASRLCVLDRRGAVGVEGFDGLEAPGLALLAFRLAPHDRLPVRRQDQPRAGIGDLDAVAAGLVDIKE